MRLTIINDYQRLAIETAEWGQLPDGIVPDVFHDQLTNSGEAARRLAPYDIIVTAREEVDDGALIKRTANLKPLSFTVRAMRPLIWLH